MGFEKIIDFTFCTKGGHSFRFPGWGIPINIPEGGRPLNAPEGGDIPSVFQGGCPPNPLITRHYSESRFFIKLMAVGPKGKL